MLNVKQLLISLNNVTYGDTAFLLGAGCSIDSGCLSSKKLIEEFKRRIYFTEKNIPYSDNAMIDEEELNVLLKKRFGEPQKNEYSYYFESCFPLRNDRNLFIKNKFKSKSPSLGYLCFADYLMNKNIHYVLTTNFDDLIIKAINRVDPNYDVAETSDSLQPIVGNKLNVVKLHGDYNYDGLRNTEKELASLGVELASNLRTMSAKRIVVIGYSGLDKSVMQFLKEYLNENSNCTLYWCIINEYDKNDDINELLKLNEDSAYVLINSFDDLFIDYCKIYDSKFSFLNYEQNNVSIRFNQELRQKENVITNLHPIIEYPNIFVIEDVNLQPGIIEKANESINYYIFAYKNKVFVAGDIHCFINEQLIDKSYTRKNLGDCSLPIKNKLQILKNIVFKSLINKGFGVSRDSIIFGEGSYPPALQIRLDFFDNQICLLTNANYIINKDEINQYDKYQINKLKSQLYGNKNFNLMNSMEQRIMPDFKFDFYGSNCSFNKNTLEDKGNNGMQLNGHTIVDEPFMSNKISYGKNQISLINQFGPIKFEISKEKIKIGIICPEEGKKELCLFLSKLINGNDKYYVGSQSIVPLYKGFEKTYNKPLEYTFLDTKFYSRQFLHSGIHNAIDSYINACKRLYETYHVDLVLIYFSKEMEKLKEVDGLDFHDSFKLKCLNAYKTQFLEYSTLQSNDDYNKILFSFATAIYAKTVGMAWRPKNINTNNLYLGMSFGFDKEGINVGCSQLFDGAGRGLKLIVSKISDKKRKNQYLSKDEAYNLGKRIRATYYSSSKIEDIDKIVIHRSSPFMKEEIEGFKEAFEGLNGFDLIQIIDNTKFNCFVKNEEGIDGYPVYRGTIIKDSKNSFYFWTDGKIIDNEILGGKTFRNSKRGMGSPLKIVVHHGNSSIEEIASEILFLTKMDFNSGGNLHSRLPVTIKYSQIVCDLLKQGKSDQEEVDFEYIM